MSGMKLPTGSGFSRKFVFVLIGGVIVFILIILFLLDDFGVTQQSKQDDQATSQTAESEINALNAQKTPVLLLKGWHVVLADGKSYPVIIKNGLYYVKGANHALIPLSDGGVVYKNGRAYQYEQGKLTAFSPEAAKTGDIEIRDGKAYQLGQDGKWHPYSGKLQAGQVVWRAGKAYVVGQDGKLHAVGDTPQVGDYKAEDGTYYRLGKDGKWHAISGKPPVGAIVYKHGKAYVVDQEGHLRAIGTHPKAGDLIEKHGQFYQLAPDGTLHPYLGKLKTGQVVWKDGKAYVVGKDGTLQARASQSHGTTPQVGDYKAQDGLYYRLGKDGKWHPISGKPPVGATVYKDGKAYVLGEDGTLQARASQSHGTTPQVGDYKAQDGLYYRLGKDGKWHAISGKPPIGAIVYQDGKAYVVGQDEKLHTVGSNAAREKKLSAAQAAALQAQYKILQQAARSSLIAIKNESTESASSSSQNNKDQLALLKAQHAALSAAHMQHNEYDTQNGQANNVAFLKVAQKPSADQLKSHLRKPSSPYTIYAGSFIPATLITGINSDLPGQIMAQVNQNVFDTVSGNYLLIPQGTRLVGAYSSQVMYGQSRVLIVWNRLIFPNGNSIDLEGMAGADLEGFAGLHDQVNNHYRRVFGSALMFSIFGALGQLSQPNNDSQNGYTNQQIIYGAIGQQLMQTAMQRVAKDLNIQPTINIRQGDNFNVLITRDIVLPAPYQF